MSRVLFMGIFVALTITANAQDNILKIRSLWNGKACSAIFQK